MRSLIRRWAPNMFHRRLLLLAGVAAIGLSLLCGQLINLTLAQHASLRETAEAALVTRELIPTLRGAIEDRHGRVLAADRPGHDVSVRYDMITGESELFRTADIDFDPNDYVVKQVFYTSKDGTKVHDHGRVGVPAGAAGGVP